MSTGRGSTSSGSRGRRSSSRDSQRSDRSSERTDPLAGVTASHRMYRALQQDQPGTSAPQFRPSAPQRPYAPPPPPSGYPSPSADLFARPPPVRAPDVRMPEIHLPSSGGGSSVPSEPPPALFYPPRIPAIPDVTPEGVPIPEDPRHPRFLTVQQAYVYQPFEGMTLERARRSSKTKASSSTATSAAGNKKNV